jgi:hypothetical protein
MLDNFSRYIPNYLYGFFFKRIRTSEAMTIPEGDKEEGNIRLKQVLQVKINGIWQEVKGGNGPIDAMPTIGSPNAVSSGGTAEALAGKVSKLTTITLNNTTKTLQTNLTFTIGISDIPGLQNQLNAEILARTNADNLIKGAVPVQGDSLLKLYNLIVNQFQEKSVETIAERDALNIQNLPSNIFVKDDGDGKWALYKAITTGSPATFVKLSDPDLLNAAMTSSQIKASYESNPDTNAFTNTLKAKLEALYEPDISGIAANAIAIGEEEAARIAADNVIIAMINYNAGLAKQFTDSQKAKLLEIIEAYS